MMSAPTMANVVASPSAYAFQGGAPPPYVDAAGAQQQPDPLQQQHNDAWQLYHQQHQLPTANTGTTPPAVTAAFNIAVGSTPQHVSPLGQGPPGDLETGFEPPPQDTAPYDVLVKMVRDLQAQLGFAVGTGGRRLDRAPYTWEHSLAWIATGWGDSIVRCTWGNGLARRTRSLGTWAAFGAKGLGRHVPARA